MKPETVILQNKRERGWTLTWLAAKLGISVTQLHHILRGRGHRKQTLTPERRQQIYKILQIQPDEQEQA